MKPTRSTALALGVRSSQSHFMRSTSTLLLGSQSFNTLRRCAPARNRPLQVNRCRNRVWGQTLFFGSHAPLLKHSFSLFVPVICPPRPASHNLRKWLPQDLRSSRTDTRVPCLDRRAFSVLRQSSSCAVLHSCPSPTLAYRLPAS